MCTPEEPRELLTVLQYARAEVAPFLSKNASLFSVPLDPLLHATDVDVLAVFNELAAAAEGRLGLRLPMGAWRWRERVN
jgi:hypothetical protein